jgi:hypothetical protein
MDSNVFVKCKKTVSMLLISNLPPHGKEADVASDVKMVIFVS